MIESKKAHIVGGGIGGLTAGIFLARKGIRVALYEQASVLGGRSKTRSKLDFQHNIGPHALYANSYGANILAELGLRYNGHVAGTGGFSQAIYDHHYYELPSGACSLFRTRLFSSVEKFQMLKLLRTIKVSDPESFAGLNTRQWIDSQTDNKRLRQWLESMVRLTTYINAPEHLSASIAVCQLKLGFSDRAIYINNGWQTLVSQLRQQATSLGVQIYTRNKITSIEQWKGEHVVLAIGPFEAGRLLGRDFSVNPVRVACLDIALSKSPISRAVFALGIDVPLYFSNHNISGSLGPKNAGTIHLMTYLKPGESYRAEELQVQMEDMMDKLQPGWRDRLIYKRFMPNLVVMYDLPRIVGRYKGEVVHQQEMIQLVGDWIGESGLLLDASLLSAKAAAQRIINAIGC